MSEESSPPHLEAKPSVDNSVETIERLLTIPAILKAVVELTGMRYVVVARVTAERWVACAVLDEMDFGLLPGGELEVATTLCSEVRDRCKPIVISHASRDEIYANHPTPKKYGIESYIAVPITLKNGEFFGTLCAVDSKPADLSDEAILASMNLFAELIAKELSDDDSYAALMDSEAKRRESEDRIRAVTDAMPGLISYIDTEYRYQFVNRAYTDWFGLDADNIVRRPLWEVLGQAAFENLRPHVDSALAGKTEIFETEVAYRLGGTRFIRASYTPDVLAGKVRGIFVLVVDISEERRARDAVKRSEERYRAFIKHSTEGIWRFELDEPIDTSLPTDEQVRRVYRLGYLAECNDAMARQYGFSSADDIVGTRLPELLVEDDPKNVEFITAFIESGYHLSEAESHERDANGNDRYFLNNFVGIIEDGKLVRAWGLQRDITAAKLADDATARLAAIVVSSDDAIISKDLSGTITSWNIGAERMLGYTAEEVIGKPISILLPPDRAEESREILRRIRREETVEHYETLRRRKDGTDVIVSLSASPIRNSDGIVIGASKIIRDITERKRIEETIYENQLMLTLAMQSSKMGVWELDLATNTVSWSEELEQIFGLPKGSFGGTEEHFFELIHEDDREDCWNTIRGAIAANREYTIEFRFHHADGSIRWLEGRGQAVYSQTGQPVRLYGIGMDITDRKQAEKALRESERRFSRFMQHLPGLAWIKDADGRYVYANESAERSFGVSGDALYGKTDEEIFPAETAEQFRMQDRRAMESGTGIQIVDSMVESDGVLHHSVVSKFPIAGPDGKPALIGGMAIDITEQKQAEESLRNSEEKYRALFDSMDEGYCIIEVIFDDNDRPVDYRFVEVNSAFERQAGMHDVTGKRMLEFVTDIEDHWLENYGRVAKTGEPIRFANEYKGLNRWFDVYAFSPSQAPRNYVAVLFTDITSRVRTEESLRESSEFNQDVIDSIAAHIAVLNDAGEITAVNEAWRQFAVDNGADWTMNNVGVGTNYLDICRGASGDNAEEAYAIYKGIKMVLEGETDYFSLEYPCHSPATKRWFLLTVSPLTRTGGGAVVSHQNVTERRLAEQNIRESEARFRMMADNAPVMIWVTDPTGYCTFLSQSWYESTGQTPETGLGFGWLNAVHPDDRLEVERRFTDANEKGVAFSSEYRFATFIGEYHWAIDSAQPRFDASGNYLGFIGSIVDIHERKLAEQAMVKAERRAAEEYQLLLGRIVPLAATLGRARDLTTIYRAVRDFLLVSMPCSGFFVSFFDPEKSLRNAAYVWGDGEEIDISELPPMELKPEGGGANSRAVFEKRTIITNNYWDEMKKKPHVVLRRDGRDPHSSLIVPMMLKDAVLGTLEVQAYENQVYGQDHAVALEMAANLAAVAIENVRLIETEGAMREAAEAANRAKDEFLSVLSHELRTPLNAMLGWVRMLKADVLDEENSARALEVIERNTRLQSSLIEDLLDVSRIISGKMRIETELVDLVSVVETVSETIRPLAEAKGVLYRFEREDEAVYLTADTVRLQQVVSNLLQNSIKFTPAGGEVTISIERTETNAILSVRDTGVGIEQELLPFIFDRFRQADASARRNFTGLGLGLTIVRNIVELHNGHIDVYSDGKDKGSQFVVTLPLSVDFYTSEAPREEELASKGSLQGKAILLVDDDAENLTPLQIFLESEKADVTPAMTAREALAHLAEREFHVMITDIGMPEMDGYELVAELRRQNGRNSGLKTIALTAYASVDDRQRALESGFHAHLAKPVNFDELLAAIEKVSRN